MKNNQFRAYIDKYIKKNNEKLTILTLDKDSNTRIVYLYKQKTRDCIGSIVLYFTNEYFNISFSKSNKRVCSLVNRIAAEKFDYCELKQAIMFLEKAIEYFIKGE